MMPSPPGHVVNVRTGAPFDVYIGRACPRARDPRCRVESRWGNPFGPGRPGRWRTRCVEESLEKYEEWMRDWLDRRGPEMARHLLGLRGLRLGCWCKPDPCHGDVLLRLVDEYGERYAGRELPAGLGEGD